MKLTLLAHISNSFHLHNSDFLLTIVLAVATVGLYFVLRRFGK